MFVITKPDNY
ncbi:hypothetical protein CGLO_13491 [Colletotrichum gloeosporioides Cg-14]|uniref:Uncharacterized protein n=1 Tax=Colletotrichum gloeosporioides (strain Cg-14) TaxID=1237896 RepID=T0LGM8_COLGC|nr:hypothetical protein CGLO_13491 [Colletotrichum gloeosporioides Cg-14]